MARPYSQDLRERTVRAVLSGQSRREAARLFDVSASCVIKLMRRLDATGECRSRKFGGHKRHALAVHEDKVRALVAENVNRDRVLLTMAGSPSKGADMPAVCWLKRLGLRRARPGSCALSFYAFSTSRLVGRSDTSVAQAAQSPPPAVFGIICFGHTSFASPVDRMTGSECSPHPFIEPPRLRSNRISERPKAV